MTEEEAGRSKRSSVKDHTLSGSLIVVGLPERLGSLVPKRSHGIDTGRAPGGEP